MKQKTLVELRAHIDRIDDHLLALLTERAEVALAVRVTKAGTSTYRPEREAAILSRLLVNNKRILSDDVIRTIFTDIISACRSAQARMRVAYLGPAGSYSHEVVSCLLGPFVDTVPHTTLTAALHAAEAGRVDAVVLPLENSSEGMVVETHTLLESTSLHVVAEARLVIRHCLLSHESKLSSIRTVHAHPQALGQCRTWLQLHVPHAELIAEPSNSHAASLAAVTPGAAAIASKQAATLYSLGVVAEYINDNPGNQTRFVMLGSGVSEPTGDDTTSIVCALYDRPGSLERLLTIFSHEQANLSRIVSRPVSPNSYLFYIDIDGHQADLPLSRALAAATLHAKDLKVLGSYPKGVTYDN